MADYIDREELLKEIKTTYLQIYSVDSEKVRKFAIQLLELMTKKMPSVDAVEVVRCKDCKHRDRLNNACLYPFIKDEEDNLYHKIVEDTDYCKWGEKE